MCNVCKEMQDDPMVTAMDTLLGMGIKIVRRDLDEEFKERQKKILEILFSGPVTVHPPGQDRLMSEEEFDEMLENDLNEDFDENFDEDDDDDYDEDFDGEEDVTCGEKYCTLCRDPKIYNPKLASEKVGIKIDKKDPIEVVTEKLDRIPTMDDGDRYRTLKSILEGRSRDLHTTIYWFE